MGRSAGARLAGTIRLASLSVALALPAAVHAGTGQPAITTRSVPILTLSGLRFRDLNRNGRLDRYEDWRLTPQQRSRDLLARMSLSEKAGLLVIPVTFGDAPPGAPSTGYDPKQIALLAHDRHVRAFGSMLDLPAGQLAEASNAIQAAVEREPLAIPASIATDPRHGYQKTVGAAAGTGGFSQWPDPVGLGAIGDPAVVRSFADIVRRDYRAVGFTVSLAPQADLATEPRWPRISGTFGEDPATVAPLVAAYVEGVQGSARGLASSGVASVVKHWVGYGAAADGLDSHNYYGRFAALGSQQLALHLKPFEAAFRVHPAAVMPAAYGTGPRPTMVFVNGLDSSKEILVWTRLGAELARRGIATLHIDQPGTGEALRANNLTAVHDTERWASVVVDYLETRADVDKARIGMMGLSLGGYYAPRAVAFEPRFALGAVWGANHDWGEVQEKRMRREGENPVPHYWQHVMWVWGQPDMESFMALAPKITLDGVLDRVRVPFLVTHGENDRQIGVEYARRTYEQLVNSPKRELKIFDRRTGGVEHVSLDNMSYGRDFIADWIAETFGERTA